MLAISYPVLLAGPFELGSSVSHFHYNYHETDMIAHMGHKVCLNVGSVVLARSWLLSGGKPMPAAALISKLGSKAREMYTSMRYDHMCGFCLLQSYKIYGVYSHKSSTAPTMASFGICSPGSIICQNKCRSRTAASLRPLCGITPSKTNGHLCT